MTFKQIMENEGFIPNDEQREVINSTVNTVVSAGAGAGKTAVLSWRFLRLVMEENVDVNQILTLTFTKKAANEMRERIYKRLLKAKDSLAEGALDKFSEATISTLDSFCLQIVKADCTSYGLARDIVNLSEDALKTLVKRLSLQFLLDKDNEKIKEELASLLFPNEILEKFFMIIAENVSLVGDYDSKRIYKQFQTYVKDLYDNRYNELIRLFKRLGECRLTPKFSEQYKTLREKLEGQCFQEGDYFNLGGIRDEEIKSIVKEGIVPILGNGTIKTGYVYLQNIALRDSSSVPVLQEAVERFAHLLNEEKRRLGSLTFNDIANLAVAILRDNLTIRKIYKEKYRFIMIDEFQDNNSLQRDLLFLLSEKNTLDGKVGIVPSIEDLEEKKLFFVGDEKQSIYKFRGADVSVFRNLQNEIKKYGKNISMKMNYRSQAHLINHFNEVFESVMKDANLPFEAKFDPIGAGRKSDNTDSKIVFCPYDKETIEQYELEDSDILEAEIVGNYCSRVLNTDDFLVNGERPRPEDIAILFRTTSNQMNIEKALKKRGLEYQITETRSLMLDAISSDFYSFINYLLYPEDKRSHIALLKSPFCGLCEESIKNIIDEKEVLEFDKSRYETFVTMYENLKENAFRLTITDLLETFYINCGYKSYLDSSKNNRTFIEHYEYLYSYAEQFDSEGKSLSDFAKFLRDNLGKAKKLAETSVLTKRISGIQMMTVHKSKGLEFKVVIYCGMGKGDPNDKQDYVFTFGNDIVSTEHKGILRVLNNDNKLKDDAEKKRVMYVAMTRAKDHLILIGGYTKSKDGLSTDDVFKWYADAIGYEVGSTIATKCSDVEIEDISNLNFDYYLNKEESSQKKEDNLSFISCPDRVSVTDLKDKHRTTNDSQKLPCAVDSILDSKNLHDKFGTLCHYVLEILMRDKTYEDVECSLSDSEKENKALLKQAKEFADNFVSSSFYNNYVKGHSTEEELRFYTALNSDTAIEGVMDLIVFTDDYNLVIDYKTDSQKNPLEHKIQVQTYAKVAKDIFKKKCYSTIFYLRDSSVSDFWDEDGNIVNLI